MAITHNDVTTITQYDCVIEGVTNDRAGFLFAFSYVQGSCVCVCDCPFCLDRPYLTHECCCDYCM